MKISRILLAATWTAQACLDPIKYRADHVVSTYWRFIDIDLVPPLTVPEAAQVELKVFNTLGQLVTTLIDETRPAGSYRVSWDGNGYASGL